MVNIGVILLMAFLFRSGLAYKILVAVSDREYPALFFGGVFILFIALILNDCRRFSNVSSDEVDSYYNQ